MPLVEKIHQGLKRRHLIQPADKILVGVSGGADSMALLCILNKLKTKIGFQIHVGHINHHLRKTASADQNFVKKFCETLNLSYSCVELDLKNKIEQGGSVEEIARTARFKALTEIAKKVKAHKIALAHQRDDLAETVLLRILRGTGLQGLQAILPQRKINGHLFIRPLLEVSRDEIKNYLKKNKIQFRNDLTNQQTYFFRNKIRLELLPYLENKYQKNIKQLLCNLAITSSDDYEFIRQHALKVFPTLTTKSGTKISITLTKFKDLPNALKRMTLRLAVESIKGNTHALTLTHLLEIEDLILNRPTGAVVDLPNNMKATKTKDNSDTSFLVFARSPKGDKAICL